MPNETWSAEEWKLYNEDMAADDADREEQEERLWEWHESEDRREQMIRY